LELHRTEPADLDAVASLLVSVFDLPADDPLVNRDVLEWKYFAAGPQWEGSRSYVLRKGEKIFAHCAVWPLNLHFADRQVTCLCYIDWAGLSDLPGAGFILKKKLMKLSDTSIVVGGSDETREIVPKLGFAHIGDVKLFARVVRPWKQSRSRPAEPLPKRAARLARNALWSLSGGGTSSRNWSAGKIEFFSSDFESDCKSSFGHPTPWRDAAYLNFWLRCPAAEVTGYELIRAGARVGYFLLSRVGNQTRIADIRLNSTDLSDWKVAYCLAAETAAQDEETCEILAAASTSFAAESLQACGFRARGGMPFFLYDPKKLLTDHLPMFWNMIEGDAAFLFDPAYPYVT
jgi:hypothetical protein